MTISFSNALGIHEQALNVRERRAEVLANNLANADRKFPIQPPVTKEGYYYREIFDEMFPSNEAALTVETGSSIACSSPVAFRWSKEFEKMDDPSGRAVAVHSKAIKGV